MSELQIKSQAPGDPTLAAQTRARLVGEIMEIIGRHELQLVQMVLINLIGQIIAAQAGGKPARILELAANFGQNAGRAALAKATHDDAQRREREKKR